MRPWEFKQCLPKNKTMNMPNFVETFSYAVDSLVCPFCRYFYKLL